MVAYFCVLASLQYAEEYCLQYTIKYKPLKSASHNGMHNHHKASSSLSNFEKLYILTKKVVTPLSHPYRVCPGRWGSA